VSQEIFLSMVLPFYDEEECVRQVVEELHGELLLQGRPFEIVAIQNGSRDRTGAILAEMQQTLPELQIVTVAVNQGFGYGILQGLAAARGELIGWMPGDGQIPPSAIGPLVEKMGRESAGIGQGCRTIRHDASNRLFISKCFNLWTRLMFGLATNDINGEPKLLTAALYREMNLCSSDSFIDAEALLKAKRLGARLSCVDMVSRERVNGVSKVHSSTVIEFILNLLKARFRSNDPWGINAIPKRKRMVAEALKTL
jgi:glycosyltransferase involved in cell wall biosynthesis